MIDLPESYVIAKQINQTLKGKVIIKVIANDTPHAFASYTGNPEEYHGKLKGRTITNSDVYSGNVRIRADDMVLFISAPIKYHMVDEKIPKKHQLYIEFEDHTYITSTIQMWGGIFCYKDGDVNGIPAQHIINDAPSPLEAEFNETYFRSLLATTKLAPLSVKAFLATDQRIPGLGNGVLQDILWTAKIHPKRKMLTLSDKEITELFNAVKSVIANIANHGGRETERDLFGNRGGYKTILSKNTVNKPCPLCTTTIQKAAYLGGSIYYCKECQKL